MEKKNNEVFYDCLFWKSETKSIMFRTKNYIEDLDREI